MPGESMLICVLLCNILKRLETKKTVTWRCLKFDNSVTVGSSTKENICQLKYGCPWSYHGLGKGPGQAVIYFVRLGLRVRIRHNVRLSLGLGLGL